MTGAAEMRRVMAHAAELLGVASDIERASLPARRAASAFVDDPLMDVVPAPGRALIACRCGRALDARDMHRKRATLPGAHPIARITCEDCA